VARALDDFYPREPATRHAPQPHPTTPHAVPPHAWVRPYGGGGAGAGVWRMRVSGGRSLTAGGGVWPGGRVAGPGRVGVAIAVRGDARLRRRAACRLLRLPQTPGSQGPPRSGRAVIKRG
jgi:hypothetical protein